MEFGSRLAELLKERKLSQKDFSVSINEDPVSVNRYITGKRPPKVEFISKVIEFFPEVDLNWLFRGEVFHVNEASEAYEIPRTPNTIISNIEKEIQELKALLPQK